MWEKSPIYIQVQYTMCMMALLHIAIVTAGDKSMRRVTSQSGLQCDTMSMKIGFEPTGYLNESFRTQTAMGTRKSQ
jgi:hypothetical protein